MYKFPIRIPEGKRLTISQGFHDGHNGNDVVCGDSILTYGLPIVWPFPFPGKPWDSLVDSPLAKDATKAHAQIDGTDPATGISYSMLSIHLSGALYTVYPGQDTSIVFNEGDTIGYIGNSGSVRPKPTIEKPFDGSHLHLGLGIKKPGEANYIMTDPSLYFDVNNPFRGVDDPSRDNPVYEWSGILNPQTPPTPVIIKPSYRFIKNLEYGMTNSVDIVMLQECLKWEGVLSRDIPSTGNYYKETAKAVLAFQKKYKLINYFQEIMYRGQYCYATTRAKLNELYSQNM